jgi:hypothetical protein
MRLRFIVLASALSALVVVTAATTVSAAPTHNRGLTINATPNPVQAGGGVLLYGQLNVAPIGHQTIVLYHRVIGSHRGYARVGVTTTNPQGFYEFTRAEGVVLTNRSWFAREVGGEGVHSRTVYERVSALTSLDASTTTSDTDHPVVFTGHVTPDHSFERVLLQQQSGTSDDWRTIRVGELGPGSNYLIPYTWRVPGQHDVRVVFPGDARNVGGESDPLTVTIQQAQVHDFTITTSNPIAPEGSKVTISGLLATSGTPTPEPLTSVTLWAREAGQPQFRAVGSTVTKSDGTYSFTEAPAANTVYQARTTMAPRRHSAVLVEGVRDVLSMTSSSSTTTVGGTVTFMGTAAPNKAGHWVYLERLGSDGDWHAVEAVRVSSNSSFQFVWTSGKAGTEHFRARIYSDRLNIGTASAAVPVTVTGVTPVSSLTPSS